MKTEEVAVKEENPLQKGSQSWANISETDASGEGANADTHADNEPSSSSKPLKKENAKVVFPFGMNPVVMPANSPVEVPLKKGIASLESTSLSGSAVSCQVGLTESETSDSETSDSETSERPKSKAKGSSPSVLTTSSSSSSAAVPPLQKGAPLPKTSEEHHLVFTEAYEARKAELKKHRESSLGKGARSGRLINIWAAQGKSQQTYQQLLRRGVPKAELDWRLQQGPLSWDYPFPELNNLKVGIDWHNTLQKVRATQFPLTMSMHLNYSLRKGSRSQFCHTVGKREEHSFCKLLGN